MSAPDTSTTEGKVAVMGAQMGGKQIERRTRATMVWVPCVDEPTWNWSQYDYRIAPEPTVVPWNIETCPLGATVRVKATGERYIITGAGQFDAFITCFRIKYETLLANYEKLDPRSGNWFPAGTVEGGVQ